MYICEYVYMYVYMHCMILYIYYTHIFVRVCVKETQMIATAALPNKQVTCYV